MYFQDISSYTWFLYLGILLFISHVLLYGFGLDLSYFGLLLIYIGLARPVISDWIRYILWFFIFVDIYIVCLKINILRIPFITSGGFVKNKKNNFVNIILNNFIDTNIGKVTLYKSKKRNFTEKLYS
jgi:hypothetical protein